MAHARGSRRAGADAIAGYRVGAPNHCTPASGQLSRRARFNLDPDVVLGICMALDVRAAIAPGYRFGVAFIAAYDRGASGGAIYPAAANLIRPAVDERGKTPLIRARTAVTGERPASLIALDRTAVS